MARPFAIQVRVEDTFITELNALSDDKQKRIKIGLSNATINVRINQVISTVKRTELIRKILEELMNIDAAFEGEFRLSEKLTSFAKLDVSRGNFEGPRFKSYSASHYNPIPLEAISRKLTRRDYKVDCPIELLAFFDTQHAPLDEHIERLEIEIRKQVEQSIFRKVWIYDARRQEALRTIGGAACLISRLPIFMCTLRSMRAVFKMSEKA